ncbi:MAG: hypothetical protein IKN81_01480 [Oscillospiraceae bacterium]|nr:hypothetical protein [Oscillospiraceae bacterium]
MNDQQIELLINMLRAKGQITDLEKDIIDTYHELKKQPVDMNSAFRQMKSNELNHPDVLLKVTMMPTTGQKQASELTAQDLLYVLSAQFTFLLEKEETSQRSGN